MVKVRREKRSTADEDFSESEPLPARLPPDLIGHGRPKTAEKVAVSGVIGHYDTLDAKKWEQLTSVVIEYGVSRSEAASLAPLVDAFIKAKLSVLENPPDQMKDSALGDSVPAKAPVLYANHRKKGVNTSEEFLREVYGPWLGKGGGLYQNSLRKLDPELMVALGNAFRGRRADLLELLPTKSAAVTARLEAAVGKAIPPDKRQLVASLERGLRHAIR